MELKFEDLPRAMTEMMLEIRSIKEKVFENTKVEQKAEVMNTKECAAYLKVSLPSLYNYVNRGSIPYFKIGNKKYFKRDEVDEALKVK